jgi:hypothetical protein
VVASADTLGKGVSYGLLSLSYFGRPFRLCAPATATWDGSGNLIDVIIGGYPQRIDKSKMR